MRAYDIILKKRNGEKLSKEEIYFFVHGFTRGEIPDYQMAAFLMAVYFQGMDDEEVADLTMAMVESGDKVDLSAISGIKVDKHSTGGVGDKTTLVLAPLVAAVGVPVAKMSGRGLGHTGGTLDKLESIAGFNVALSPEEFIKQVNDIGIAVIGQTAKLAPADGKMYALRDVTATVDSLPLIASSIMSKKIAGGADAIVLDVKTGSGAFMKDLEGSIQLAQAMVKIGERVGRETIAVISEMGEPLGFAVGNSLEVKEAIATLKGEGPEDLTELCLTLGGYMVFLARKADTFETGKEMLKEALQSGKAFAKLKEFVKSQGGNVHQIDDPALLPKAQAISQIKAEKEGFVIEVDALKVGLGAMYLGAGRAKKEDKIDHSVGIVLRKKVGDKVLRGDVLAELHYNDEKKLEDAQKIVFAAFKIDSRPPQKAPFIKAVVTSKGVEKYV
ncbi:pyrimidine-nucleoside phosphorylase [Carboxydothermus hydrogenoformans]|uniref:Pyrimidine-nucleoside phosphorylase n=1 Tax=Carboxydothermus hydrogenoformans (strain ATCC BAA-161 / DSM 6008 / Z-2901) TaxID=246194 RepID=Q3ABU8_CARHZ|nr:pyrimidine-nucleoside phosphorylase [Carboxydothermus hydrogenoformans]ABB14837.1 pyrimidine-nucleoside phosphorylase [Carboxydothermus hydrogenoformans Z-2901]